jgi:hypothetical protein
MATASSNEFRSKWRMLVRLDREPAPSHRATASFSGEQQPYFAAGGGVKLRLEEKPRSTRGYSAGVPVFAACGSRVSVIVGQIAHGASWDEVLADYPALQNEDIQ